MTEENSTEAPAGRRAMTFKVWIVGSDRASGTEIKSSSFEGAAAKFVRKKYAADETVPRSEFVSLFVEHEAEDAKRLDVEATSYYKTVVTEPAEE